MFLCGFYVFNVIYKLIYKLPGMYVDHVCMLACECVCGSVGVCSVWCVFVCSALETDRSQFKAKLLVALPKVCHLDVQQREMLQLRRVDLQDCPVKAFTILQERPSPTLETFYQLK